MKMTVEVGAVERRPARFKHDDLVRADLLSLSGEQRFAIKVNRARKQNMGMLAPSLLGAATWAPASIAARRGGSTSRPPGT
jgi:hypothetical protein